MVRKAIELRVKLNTSSFSFENRSVSVPIDPPHPSAVERFNELSAELLAAVAVFPAAPRPPRGFTPNRSHPASLTEADIIGDPQLGWQAEQGERTGITTAHPRGLRTGLVGDGYTRLQSLAKAMVKTCPFSEYASIEFLEQRLFEWKTEKVNGGPEPECSAHVLAALKECVSEYRIAVPISDLFVQSPLNFGSVTVRTFPDAVFERYEALSYPDAAEADRHRQFARSCAPTSRDWLWPRRLCGPSQSAQGN